MANQFGIQVTVDASKATAGAREFQRSAQDIAHSAKTAAEGARGLRSELASLETTEVKEALEGIRGSLETLNAALRTLGIGAVVVELEELMKIGLELEDAFKHLAVAANATQEQMDQFAAATRKMSDAFGKSQIEVAAAQLNVAKSGYADVAQNAQVTAAALELSKIGFVNAATATDTLTRVMQAYNLKADQATNVMQSLFVAAKSGKIDIGELGNLFSRMGSDIQASGISINDVLAAVTALGRSGENGYRAMYGIQELLRNIAEPSTSAAQGFEDFRAALDQAGIHATSLQQLVGQQGLVGALKTLVEVSKGNQDVLRNVLGTPQAAITAIQLVTTAAKNYGDVITELSQKQKLAADADKQVSESAAFLAETFRAKVENSLIGLASKSLEVLAPMFQYLNDHFGQVITVAEVLATVLAGRLIVAIVSTGASMLAAAVETTGFTLTIQGLKVAILALDLVLSPLLIALGTLVALMAALAAGLAVGYVAYGLFTGGLKGAKQAYEDEIDLVSRLIDKFHELSVARSSSSDVSKAAQLVGHGGATPNPLTHKSASDATNVHTAGTAQNKSKADQNDLLVKTYKGVREEVDNLAKAQEALTLARQGAVDAGGNVLKNTAELALATEKLQEQVFKQRDALTQYSDKLKETEGKYDPVIAANESYRKSLRDLQEQYAISGGSAVAYAAALDQLKLKHDQDLIAAQAKKDAELALSETDKALINTTAQQQEREAALNDALDRGIITRQQYNLALEDSADQIAKASLATEALTAGQLKLAQAEQAMNEANTKADQAGLTGDARSQFLAEYADKVAQAKQHTDELADAVDKLAEQYDPLLKAQHDYQDTLQRINDLERERPDLTGELESTRSLAKLSAQKAQISGSVLPATDRTALDAANEYATTVTRLNQELQEFKDTNGQAGISQQQFNQALLEANQHLNAAQASYSTYTKAVIDGGKAINDALSQMFDAMTQRGFRLRGVFSALSKELYQSASKLLETQLQQKAYSGLANSGVGAISRFGQNLASGAGVQLIAHGGQATGSASLSVAGTTLTTAGGALTSAAASLTAAAASLGGGGIAGKGAGLVGSLFSGAKGGSPIQALSQQGLDSALQSETGSILGDSAKALAGSGGGGGGGGAGTGSWVGLAAKLISHWFTAPTGGHVDAGATGLVGERGPEVVTFGSSGQVHSTEQVRQAVGAASGQGQTVVSAPTVHVPVQVVNVDDPNKVPSAMQSDAGQRSIINVLSSNRSQIKSILG